MCPYQPELFDKILYCIIHYLTYYTIVVFAYINFMIFYYIVLDALAFERLLGPCMDIFKRNEKELKDMMSRTFGSKVI